MLFQCTVLSLWSTDSWEPFHGYVLIQLRPGVS